MPVSEVSNRFSSLTGDNNIYKHLKNYKEKVWKKSSSFQGIERAPKSGDNDDDVDEQQAVHTAKLFYLSDEDPELRFFKVDKKFRNQFSVNSLQQVDVDSNNKENTTRRRRRQKRKDQNIVNNQGQKRKLNSNSGSYHNHNNTSEKVKKNKLDEQDTVDKKMYDYRTTLKSTDNSDFVSKNEEDEENIINAFYQQRYLGGSNNSIATLCNIGNSCYLNSVIYTLRFAPYFLHKLHHLCDDMHYVYQKIGQNKLKSSSLGRNVSGIQVKKLITFLNNGGSLILKESQKILDSDLSAIFI